MDDNQYLKDRYKFPNIPSTGSGHTIPDLKGASLLLETETLVLPVSAPRNWTTLQLLGQTYEQPLTKCGLIILFLTFIMVLTTSIPVLSWLGMAGILTGSSLIGLSLFNTRSEYSRTRQPTTDNSRGELTHDRFDP